MAEKKSMAQFRLKEHASIPKPEGPVSGLVCWVATMDHCTQIILARLPDSPLEWSAAMFRAAVSWTWRLEAAATSTLMSRMPINISYHFPANSDRSSAHKLPSASRAFHQLIAANTTASVHSQDRECAEQHANDIGHASCK